MALVAINLACDEVEEPLECSGEEVCTEVFVTIGYTPRDEQNNPIVFDSFYSHNLDYGIIYNFSDYGGATTAENYVIITDQEIGDLRSTGTTIRFIGEINGEIVHQQDFLVGHDCCHVELLQGPGVEN